MNKVIWCLTMMLIGGACIFFILYKGLVDPTQDMFLSIVQFFIVVGGIYIFIYGAGSVLGSKIDHILDKD